MAAQFTVPSDNKCTFIISDYLSNHSLNITSSPTLVKRTYPTQQTTIIKYKRNSCQDLINEVKKRIPGTWKNHWVSIPTTN